MQDGAGRVVHLVELVDAADAAIGQDERARFQHKLPGLRVARDVGRETDSRGAFAAGVNTTRGDPVHVGEQLGLGGGRVAAEEHVDVAAVLWAASLVEGLVGAAEELKEDPLLHVVHLVDRRSQGARQEVIDVRPGAGLPDLRLFFSIDSLHLLEAWSVKGSSFIVADGERGGVGTHTLVINFLDVHRVDVGLMNALDGALAGIHAHGCDPEHARKFNAVTGFAEIDELIVDADRHRMRRLAGRHRVWCLLELDDLLVGEAAPVVDNLHGVFGPAPGSGAFGGLTNLAAVQGHRDRMATDVALEESILHIGDDWRCSDDKPLDADEFVHVRRVQSSEIDSLVETIRPNGIQSIVNLVLQGRLLGLRAGWTRRARFLAPLRAGERDIRALARAGRACGAL